MQATRAMRAMWATWAMRATRRAGAEIAVGRDMGQEEGKEGEGGGREAMVRCLRGSLIMWCREGWGSSCCGSRSAAWAAFRRWPDVFQARFWGSSHGYGAF